MGEGPEQAKTIDNVSCRLGDDIAGFLNEDACLFVASNGFSLSAFEHLADELESVMAVRFVFTAPAFVPRDAVTEKLTKERREFYIPGVGEASLFGTEYEIRLRNRLMQKAVAKRCGEWIRKGKVRFMSVAEYGQIQDMFIIETTGGSVVYLPFHGFTADTLGYARGAFSSAISTRMGGPFVDPFRTRFDEVWAGGGLRDVTEELSDYISNVYRDNEPELVYYLVLKHLFEEAIRDFDADSMPNSAVGYEDSLVWRKLFDFQHDAAIAIINKLERFYNTAAIGKFPEHLPAQSETVPISTDPNAVKIKELNDALIARSFCVYTPTQYILPSRRQHYDDLMATHTRRGGTIHQAGREFTLKNLMVVNVLKRLESSVFSFRKTLAAILAKNESLLAMLEAGTSGTVGTSGTEIEDLDDEEEIASLSVGRHAIDIADLDVESYKRDLREDIAAFKDILFGTDCVSEGQNLQDCDTVVNYDIHWNPVRIIQRFGRVDRIGSRNASVQLVNFWPDIALNEYIDLTDRVKNRMTGVMIAGTGTDNPLSEGEDIGFRDEPLTRMKGGEIVEMENLRTGVSITDLGLNEYALALKKYIESHPSLGAVPPGVNAVVAAKPDEGLVPGVVFFLRNRDEKLRNEANYFHPFYAVYLTMDGSVVKDSTQGKSIIELLRKGCEGRSQPLGELCREFNRETKDGFRMEKYSALLTAAISSIAEKKCESDIDSLFNSTETTALAGDCSNLDAFELMAFFVVKDSELTLRAQDR